MAVKFEIIFLYRHSAALFGTDETVLDQVSTMVNHDGVIRVSSNHKKNKGFFTSVEDAQETGTYLFMLIREIVRTLARNPGNSMYWLGLRLEIGQWVLHLCGKGG